MRETPQRTAEERAQKGTDVGDVMIAEPRPKKKPTAAARSSSGRTPLAVVYHLSIFQTVR